MKIIAHIHTDFPEKFGLPRQSGLVSGLLGCIRFEPEYNNPDAIKGIEAYDYLWLLWGFENTDRDTFTPLVRPPRLGGNKKMGVFATRSPFRPNGIGLSSVKLESVELTDSGPVLWVSGIDMRDGTPIYDIKPYLAYTDSHPEAGEGFAADVKDDNLKVEISEELCGLIPEDKRESLIRVLEQDPRPHYQDDPDRIYGMAFGGFNISFLVKDRILSVVKIEQF